MSGRQQRSPEEEAARTAVLDFPLNTRRGASEQSGRDGLVWNELTWARRLEVIHTFNREMGVTPLHAAAEMGGGRATEAARALLDNDTEEVEVNAQLTDGNTALHIAVRRQELPLAKLLLERGASVSLANSEGLTPLHVCASSSSEDSPEEAIERSGICAALLAAGADVDAVTEDGRTALHISARSLIPQFMGLLLEAGAQVDVADGQGDTPLHIAASGDIDYDANRILECVELLVQHGASGDVADANGKRAFELLRFPHERDTQGSAAAYKAYELMKPADNGPTMIKPAKNSL